MIRIEENQGFLGGPAPARPGGAAKDAQRGARAVTSVAKQMTRRLAGRSTTGRRSVGRIGQARFQIPRIGTAAQTYAQRVVVQTRYYNHTGAARVQAFRRHVRYVGREEVGAEGEAGVYYDASRDGLDGAEITKEWAADPRHWRVMVSPEEGAEMHRQGGLSAYIRGVVAAWEKALDTDLEWIAVDHHNTDNPHTHIIVRGVDARGRELRLPPHFVSHGMREMAQDRATEILGERSLETVRQALRRETTAERFTSLDRAISNQMTPERIVETKALAAHRQSLMAGRLQHLERLGLAEKVAGTRWKMAQDFAANLRTLGERKDIIKQIGGHVVDHDRAENVSVFDPRNGETVVGRVLAKGPADEITDARFVLIEDAKGRVHYARLHTGRALDRMEIGGIVKLGPERREITADRNIADIARQQGGVYDPERHRAHVDRHMQFIPERERDAYVASHITRLETLERAGVAAAMGDGRYVVMPDCLEEQGRAVAAKMIEGQQRGRFARLEVMSPRALDKQIEAKACTWLDRELAALARGDGPSVPHDAVITQALEARKEFLIGRDLGSEEDGVFRHRPGAEDALHAYELERAAERMEARFDKPVLALPPEGKVSGVYRGNLNLHAGRHAILEGSATLHLVPMRSGAQYEAGERLDARLVPGRLTAHLTPAMDDMELEL